MKLHLLDMGSKIYGDCIVVIEGNRKILIDGAHPGDQNSSGSTPSIPDQLRKIFGAAAPFKFDLLVVTHCHLDHIGCLPKMVADGTVEFEHALVADEALGFPNSGQDAALDAETAKLIAGLQEEPQPDLRGAALDEFLTDAATLAEKYDGMLATLKSRGTRIVRYTGPSAKVTALEGLFSDFKLKVLGPTAAHLKKCRDVIRGSGSDALAAIDGLRQVDSSRSAAEIYRAVISDDAETDTFVSDELRDMALDAGNASAARNDQSIILKFGSGQSTSLLTGDMQLADPEVSGLDNHMSTLLQTIKAAGPYQFVKIPHHASHNAFDQDVLDAFSATKAFAISTGRGDPKHPERSVLELLRSVTSNYKWARTDRNGGIEVSFANGNVRLKKDRGALNDASANTGDAPLASGVSVVQEPGQLAATRVNVGGAAGQIEVVARIPHVSTKVTITVEVEPALAASGTGGPSKRDPKPAGRPLAPAYTLAGGRALPKLLFVTNKARLADNIGRAEAEQAFAAIAAAGQSLVDLDGAAAPHDYVREAAAEHAPVKGVVVLGGYDLVAAERYDALPPSVRSNLGASSDNDPDDFIVWSDQIYGDIDDDGLADIPVSRIPDGRSATLVRNALCGCSASSRGGRFGLRNSARPFADKVYNYVTGQEAMLKSRPTRSQAVTPAAVDASHIYIMLHGSDSDTSRFWGEAAGGMLEAMRVGNIPDPCGGVVFAGCCWGALTVRERALIYRDGDPIQPVTPEQSLALSFLGRGARAFIGCTGAHYSPIDGNLDYFGAPMHDSFWKHIAAGKQPAQALFDAKVDYIATMPHNRTTVEEIAIENKILRQFTCLGLGW